MLLIIALVFIGYIVVGFLDEPKKQITINSDKDIEEALNLNKDDRETVESLIALANDEELETSERLYKAKLVKSFFFQKAKDIRAKDYGFLPFGLLWLFCLIIYKLLLQYGWHDEQFYLSYPGVFNIVADKDVDLCKLYADLSNYIFVYVAGLGYLIYTITSLVNEDNVKLPESKMFFFSISLLMISFFSELILFKYLIWPHGYFYIIKRYFGFCNLWHAIVVLVQMIVVFVCHHYARKHHYMKEIENQIKKYYEKQRP